MNLRLAEAWKNAGRLFHKDIWQTAHLKDNSPRGWFYATLRVISITWTVFNETKAPSRAAALSFSSLLALGPMIAIAVLIGGFMLGENEDPNLVANKLISIIKLVVPGLNQLDSLDRAGDPADAPAEQAIATATPLTVDPQLVDIINGVIAGARSGSAGAAGALSLVLIVLLLFKSIEDAFNDIWGVRDGRSWFSRLVHYWTILTAGAVLFITSVALLGATAISSVFANLPFGGKVLSLGGQWTLHTFSFVLLVGVLTLCYRAIPNTRVLWKAAFCGALVVATLLMLNNYLAFLYLNRVVLERSLYGALGFLPVLTLGIYVFWFYVLTGAVISYGVQNVHFRNSQAAWGRLSEAMRERLSLVVLLTICRRFQACLPPVSALQLSTMMKVPTQILNESINRLVDIKLISAAPPADDAESTADNVFLPARPLNRITLFEFKTLDEELGDDPTGDTLERLDPLLNQYNSARKRLGKDPIFSKTIEELLAEYPFEESRAPFQTLTAR